MANIGKGLAGMFQGILQGAQVGAQLEETKANIELRKQNAQRQEQELRQERDRLLFDRKIAGNKLFDDRVASIMKLPPADRKVALEANRETMGQIAEMAGISYDQNYENYLTKVGDNIGLQRTKIAEISSDFYKTILSDGIRDAEIIGDKLRNYEMAVADYSLYGLPADVQMVGNGLNAARKLVADKNLLAQRGAQKPAGSTAEPKSKFLDKMDFEQGKSAAELQTKTVGSSQTLDTLNNAMKQLVEYTTTTKLGTGPVATAGGTAKYADEKLQTLDTTFGKVSLTNLVDAAKGMSRAFDSDAERAFFEKTQPSIKLDDKVNAQIILGAQSALLKTQAEAQAQKDWINAGNTSLRAYESPIIGKKSVLINPEGKPELVDASSEAALLKEGYQTQDQYVKTLFKGKKAKSSKQEPATTIEGIDIKF